MAETNLQRPLGVGGILDAGLSIYRRHFVTALASVGILVVPLALLGPVLGDVGSAIAEGLLAFIPTAVAAHIVAAVAAGERPTVGSVWARVTPQVVPLILTAAMIAVPLVVLFLGVLLVAPPLLLLLVGPLIVVLIWLTQVAPVVAIENRYYLSAARRSKQLVSGSWWRVFGILFVIGLINVVASWAVVAPFAGAALDGTGPAAVAAQAVAALLITPATSLMAALLYFDLRLRKEGTDIGQAIDELGALPPPRT
jgi:hypothetical protein